MMLAERHPQQPRVPSFALSGEPNITSTLEKCRFTDLPVWRDDSSVSTPSAMVGIAQDRKILRSNGRMGRPFRTAQNCPTIHEGGLPMIKPRQVKPLFAALGLTAILAGS